MSRQNEASRALIEALGGNTSSGMCRCPIHDDSTASLHVEASADGKVLLHCHAHCPQEALIAWCRQRGLWHTTPRPPEQQRQRQPNEQRQREQDEEQARQRTTICFLLREVAQYRLDHPESRELLRPYFSGRGIDTIPPAAYYMPQTEMRRLADRYPECGLKRYPAMVMPMGNKNGLRAAAFTFLSADGTQNLRGGDGKSIRRTPGLKTSSFAQLTELPGPDQSLIVAEGIEKAAAVRGLLGHAAIATVGVHIPELPRCAKVLIASDNDAAGQRWATDLAAHVTAAGGVAGNVAPPSRFKDWDECLLAASGAERDQYIEAFENAPPFEGGGAGEHEMADERELDRLAPTVEQVLALEIPPLEFLMQPWLWKGQLGMLHAQRGEFKTRVAMQVAHSIACGQPFVGCWPVPRACRVLYVEGELPGTLLQKRLGLLGVPTANLRFVSRDLLLRDNIVLPDLASEAGQRFLDRIIEAQQSELIFLDSLSTLVFSGIENDAEPWVPIQRWAMAQRFRGRSLWFVHHEGRSGLPRGTSKREDVLDVILALKAKQREVTAEDSEEVTLEVRFTKTREIHPNDAAPRLLHLKTTSGTAVWRHELVRDQTRERVAELHRQNVKQKDIAKEVKLSQSQVSRILAKVVSLDEFRQQKADGPKDGKRDEPKRDEPKRDEPKRDEPKRDEPKQEDATENEPILFRPERASEAADDDDEETP
jgi:putative DNA primase/helicase